MVFVKYRYGSMQKDIKVLLRERLALRDKIRYHTHKISTIRLSCENKILDHNRNIRLKNDRLTVIEQKLKLLLG